MPTVNLEAHFLETSKSKYHHINVDVNSGAKKCIVVILTLFDHDKYENKIKLERKVLLASLF